MQMREQCPLMSSMCVLLVCVFPSRSSARCMVWSQLRLVSLASLSCSLFEALPHAGAVQIYCQQAHTDTMQSSCWPLLSYLVWGGRTLSSVPIREEIAAIVVAGLSHTYAHTYAHTCTHAHSFLVHLQRHEAEGWKIKSVEILPFGFLLTSVANTNRYVQEHTQ